MSELTYEELTQQYEATLMRERELERTLENIAKMVGFERPIDRGFELLLQVLLSMRDPESAVKSFPYAQLDISGLI